MSLEENFRSFYSNFGIEQADPGNLRHVFNELYHDDFKNELDGKQSLDKGQLWNIQEVVIKSKTTASVLMFKHVNPDVVEYKVHFKGTDDPVGKTVHCAYELKEGKIFNGRAVDKSSVDTM